MNYYSETDLNSVLDIRDRRVIQKKFTPVNIRFCRDCPMFEKHYWQKNPSLETGWCRRMSYYRTYDDETPYYVYVNENSFCNEDDIEDEYQLFGNIIYHILYNL